MFLSWHSWKICITPSSDQQFCNLFLSWYRWKFVYLSLSNNHPLTTYFHFIWFCFNFKLKTNILVICAIVILVNSTTSWFTSRRRVSPGFMDCFCHVVCLGSSQCTWSCPKICNGKKRRSVPVSNHIHVHSEKYFLTN